MQITSAGFRRVGWIKIGVIAATVLLTVLIVFSVSLRSDLSQLELVKKEEKTINHQQTVLPSEEACHDVCEEKCRQPNIKLQELSQQTQSTPQEESKEKTQTSVAKSQEECREVFRSQGQGGVVGYTLSQIQRFCKRPLVFDVCEDLKKFTGLQEEEFHDRLMRKGRFHYEGEHAFWNPKTRTELAWYYATSVDYLFANSVHGVTKTKIDNVASKKYEPVLEYSGGVGNNMIYLAKKGIKVHYFGIGLIEYSFARYRAMKHGLEEFVEFKLPFSSKTGYDFDPINGPLPQDGSLGSIIALDVLEHIPDYHIVVQAMVKSLRVGGRIVERSPFAKQAVVDREKDDVRVHLSNGGISMEEAMGPKMRQVEPGVWDKIAE